LREAQEATTLTDEMTNSHMPTDRLRNENTPKVYKPRRFVFKYKSFSRSVGAVGMMSGGDSEGQ
jgi:hypothetical protein